MRWVSEWDRTDVPRSSRICSFERLIMPCRLPAWPFFTLPLAVSLKRFLAPDLVFILGILVSYGANGRGSHFEPPRHAPPGGSERGRFIGGFLAFASLGRIRPRCHLHRWRARYFPRRRKWRICWKPLQIQSLAPPDRASGARG